jgi:hypothetical protein
MHVLKILGVCVLAAWGYLFTGALLAWYWHIEYEGLNHDRARMLSMILWPIAPIIEIFSRS